MDNLVIILTGQIRTFFNNNNFTNVLNLCITKYSKILIICVLNSDNLDDITRLESYFLLFKIHDFVIINYNETYKKNLEQIVKNKINDSRFLYIKEKYLSIDIPNVDGIKNDINRLSGNLFNQFNQYYQLNIGITELLKYQVKYNIIFNITMRTRFDIKYPDNFYPHMPKTQNIIDIITFNNFNKKKLLKSMKKFNLFNITDIINFNKIKKIIPNWRIINPYEYYLSMGGDYFYNYISLQNIYEKNDFDNILYSFGDFFYFANTNTFIKLKNLLYDSWLIDTNNDELFIRFFAPELQAIYFCHNNNINILFYKNDSFLYVR
jgi:hypothetical protein